MCYEWGGSLAALENAAQGDEAGLTGLSDGEGGAETWIGLQREGSWEGWRWASSGEAVQYAPEAWRTAGAADWEGLTCGVATTEGAHGEGRSTEVAWSAKACSGTASHTLCEQAEVVGGCGLAEDWCEVELAARGRHGAVVVDASCCGCCFFEHGGVLGRVGSCPEWCATLRLAGAGVEALGEGVFAGLAQVRVVDLRYNALEGLEAGALSSLSGASRVRLGGNALRSVSPGAFAGLGNLSALELDHNALAALPPGAFAGAPSLLSLELQHNLLAAIADDALLDLPRLEALNLADNVLPGLNSTALCLPALRTLILSRNEIADLAPATFASLPLLAVLHLDGNALPTLRQGAFDGLPALRDLYLHRSNVTWVDPGAFGGLNRLQLLTLHQNQIAWLPAGLLESLRSLAFFSLANNQLSCQPLLPSKHTRTDNYALKYLPACLPRGCSGHLAEAVVVSSANQHYRTAEDAMKLEMHLRSVTSLMAFVRTDVRHHIDKMQQQLGLWAEDEEGRRWWCVGGARSFDIRFNRADDDAFNLHYVPPSLASGGHVGGHVGGGGSGGALQVNTEELPVVGVVAAEGAVEGGPDAPVGWGVGIGFGLAGVVVAGALVGVGVWLLVLRRRGGKGEELDGGVGMVRRLSRRLSQESTSNVSQEPMLRSRLSSVEEGVLTPPGAEARDVEEGASAPAGQAELLQATRRLSTEDFAASTFPVPKDDRAAAGSYRKREPRATEAVGSGARGAGVRRQLEPQPEPAPPAAAQTPGEPRA